MQPDRGGMARPRQEEAIDTVKPGPRQHSLPAHVSVLRPQEPQEVDLKLIARGKIGMPALRRQHTVTVTLTVRDDEGLAQARARRNQRDVPARLGRASWRVAKLSGGSATTPCAVASRSFRSRVGACVAAASRRS